MGFKEAYAAGKMAEASVKGNEIGSVIRAGNKIATIGISAAAGAGVFGTEAAAGIAGNAGGTVMGAAIGGIRGAGINSPAVQLMMSGFTQKKQTQQNTDNSLSRLNLQEQTLNEMQIIKQTPAAFFGGAYKKAQAQSKVAENYFNKKEEKE